MSQSLNKSASNFGKCRSTLLGFAALSVITATDHPPVAAQTPEPTAAQTVCVPSDFDQAIDAAGTRLRQFNNNAQPKLNGRIQQLKTAKGWGSDSSEQRAMDYLRDARIASLDVKAGKLLARLDELGQAGEVKPIDCAKLGELEATGLELLAVMKAKLSYTEQKIARELSGSAQAAISTPTDPGSGEAASDPFLGNARPAASEKTHSASSSKPLKGTLDDKAAASKSACLGVSREAEADPQPALKALPAKTQVQPAVKAKPAKKAQQSTKKPKPAPIKKASPPAPKWTTETARAPNGQTGPSTAGQPKPRDDLIALNKSYDRSIEGTSPPPSASDALQDGLVTEPNGYTIEEIRNASKGFFGVLSTNLAGVIEHAFKNWGRPTAYILGNEGGGAFLAGLRYGKGTVYPRFGEARPIYWHGPSVGYDFGATGSQTLILVYALDQYEDLFRSFTGVDGSAYLVGGVGLTVLKGGPVLMTPIRSGLGLRLGANVGYLRFTDKPTWNPF